MLGPLSLLIPGINSWSLTTSSVAHSLTFASKAQKLSQELL